MLRAERSSLRLAIWTACFFCLVGFISLVFPIDHASIRDTHLVTEVERTNGVGPIIRILGHDSIMAHFRFGLKLLGDERVGSLEGVGNFHGL